MVALLRQFLVVLLVLLQNAAPLLHAHTDGNPTGARGIHFHAFETLAGTGRHASSQIAQGSHHCERGIVAIGSAIKPGVAGYACPPAVLPSHAAIFAPSPSPTAALPPQSTLPHPATYSGSHYSRAPPALSG